MPHSHPAWLVRTTLALLFLALCGTSLLLWKKLEDAHQERIRERVGYQARALAAELENNLIDEVEGLRRIAILWNHQGRLPRDEWELEVRFALEHFPGYQSIQWMGEDLRMRWVMPEKGNEAAIGFRLTRIHPNFNLAMQAKASGEPQMSNSFALVQGGRGVILYTPLFISNEQGSRTFDGFLQGVFRVESLMDALLGSLDNRDFSVQLLESGQAIYLQQRPETLNSLSQRVPLHLLNNSNFALQLSPTAKLVEQLSSPLPQVVLGAGLLTSLLLVAALALALENARRASALQIGYRRLNEEVSQREHAEQDLRDSRERLQLVLDLTDSSHDGLFIFDLANREILHMNPATYASLGYSAETFRQLLKEDPEQLMPGFHTWLELVRQARRDGNSGIFQREMRRADDSLQAAEISAQLVSQNGRDYLIGVSRDNRERLELEARLQRLSQLDGLTGLYNRRYFDRQLNGEWRRLRRLGAPLALLMLDVDHFKAFNDQLGHQAGDDALRQVAQALQQSLQREGDVACRYGGEEFAIILANTAEDGARHVAERVMAHVAELQIEHPGSPEGLLTLSIGIAVSDPAREEQPDSLVSRSDAALYRAKHEGRNRTCLWEKDQG
ncbi:MULTISPECIES: diguanylate cyclase domain-containing protein [unclassified Pseudomonas]|uniref:sensor domain-containing diguanylate cyclase n=1 Tax=unclassified Pseudomonas TaxID=196821 RepID=UPI00129E93F4|nr:MULTISPECIES: diguanylate cyclase [unclassified Pseudomonas]MDH4656075.1 diguanylate cyclase [Pseudomonas sp. BN606]MRK21316.1 diguanylate cyclase [Pseudomonas sp. JG-B]